MSVACNDLTGLDGLILTCVCAGEKRPTLKGWPELRLTVASRQIQKHGGNIGLLLGPVCPCGGGLLELDIDATEGLLLVLDPLRTAGLDPDSIVRSGGKNHGWKLLYFLRSRAWAWKWNRIVNLARVKVEVRGDRMQTVIPPSAVEAPYQWVEPLPPLAELRAHAETRSPDFEDRLFKAVTGESPAIATLTKDSPPCGIKSLSSALSSKSRESDAPPLERGPKPSQQNARADRGTLEKESDLWTLPEVAWLPIIRAAYLRTYPDDPPPDRDIFRKSRGASATAQSEPFRDPFEREEHPSYRLRLIDKGEWVLRSYRDRDAAGACFMSVQQAFQALSTERKPLRKIPKREQQILTRELLAWLGLRVRPPADLKRPWWTSDSALGRIAHAAFGEIVAQATCGRRAVLDCRRLGKTTETGKGNVSYALRLLCKIGLLSRDLCTDDYPGRRPGRKQYQYQAEFDAVDRADGRLSALEVNLDRPWTWRKAMSVQRGQRACAASATDLTAWRAHKQEPWPLTVRGLAVDPGPALPGTACG